MTYFVHASLSLLVLTAALFGLAACGDDGGGQCTVDDALLAQVTECSRDSHCPCGSFCEVGVCAYECQSSDECEGADVCDSYGRCRDDGRTVGAPIPDASDVEGRLVTTDLPIDLDGMHREGVVTLRAEGADLLPARVAADAPIMLRCPGAEELASECRFDSLVGDAVPTVVGVVLTEVPGETTSYDLEVFGGSQFFAVNVRAAPTPLFALSAHDHLEGIWEGHASIVRSGSVARTMSSDTPDSLRAVSLPVEFTIHNEVGNLRTVEMSDISGFVFPAENTVGQLSRMGMDLRLDHVALPYIQGEGDPATTDAILVVASAQSTSVSRGTAGLVIDMRTSFDGIVGATYAPFIDWRITLSRTADLPMGATPPAQPTAVAVADPAMRAASPLLLEGPANTALASALGTATGAARPQAVLCSPDGAAAALLSGAEASPWSGDLGCAAPAPDDQPRIFDAYKKSSWNIATTIGECVNDLELAEATSLGTPTSLVPAGCVDAARFALALSEAQAIDLRRAGGEAISADPELSAMAHRLVQQWVHLLAFVTSQALQIDVLNDVLGGSALIARDFTQSDMLALTASGWDLLLHPRIALPLTLMPGEVTREPDYRRRLFPAGTYVVDPRHDLDVGLPVALSRDLARSLDAHGALLERARYVTSERDATEARSISFARRSIALFAFATLLHQDARAYAPEPLPWADQWEHGSSRFGIALGGLVRNLENLREGRNPLDIDDALDLPLYRVGDEESDLDRFSALTDYLVGTGSGGGDLSQVGSAVSAAEAARDDARESYTNALRTDQLYQITNQNQLNRRNAVREEFGEDIVSLCGDPDYDADLIIEGTQAVDADTCWIRQDCRRTVAESIVKLHPEDIAFAVCHASRVRSLLTASALPTAAQSLAAAEVAMVVDGALPAGDTLVGHTVTGNVLTAQFRSGGTFEVDVDFFDPAAPGADGATLAPEDAVAVSQECRAVANAHEGGRPRSSGAVTQCHAEGPCPAGFRCTADVRGTCVRTCSFHGDCPSSMLCDAGACVADTGTDAGPACYRGAVGEVAAAMTAAVTDIEIARSELADLTRAYDVQMEICGLLLTAVDDRDELLMKHEETMNTLGAFKLAADILANGARSVKDCGTSAGLDDITGGGAVACGGAIAEGVMESASDALAFSMDAVQLAHDRALSDLEGRLEAAICQKDANREMIYVNTAQLRIQRAADELASLAVQLENGKTAIRGTLAEGIEELAVQGSLEIPPIEFDFWLDSNTVRYADTFRRARRALYLGVIAVEYEFQLSTAERAAVLAATSVDDLRGILTRLRTLAATGTVGGAAPANLYTVVSLRDEVVAVGTRAGDIAAGADAINSFRSVLSDATYRVLDSAGNYLGQEIPFSLAPLRAFGTPDPGSIPLLSGADCAERLWSVNASIIGTNVLNGLDSSRTRIEIRKRNAFFSQWCGGSPDGSAYQYASTRPSRNLFLDPFSDYVPGMRTPPPAGMTFEELANADAFTAARVAPAIDVSRTDLEGDMYFNGASRELAGRGVYGEYTLFIPAEVLSTGGADEGLVLSAIDDILLRIDYVSVAN